jgi:hypothetical protein
MEGLSSEGADQMSRINDLVDECVQWLMGRIPGEPGKYVIAIGCLARSERQLRTAAKAVLKASNGTDEAAMDEAIDRLRKALK